MSKAETITLEAADGHHFSAYVSRPAGAPRAGLVVLQEVFGVNGHIRGVADGYATEGFLAIAPALFDRAERGIELGYSEDELTRGRALRGAIAPEAVLQDVAAAAAAVAEAGPTAIVGYCWGGLIAWQAAGALDLAVAVGYYGGGIQDNLARAPRCPIMLHFGDKDAFITPEHIAAIRAAYPELPIHTYPAGHGFNCDQRSDFDPESAALALERTLAFFAEHLG